MGNCWLVKEIKYVKNADEEMNALDSFDPAVVAIVDERFKSAIPFYAGFMIQQPVYQTGRKQK